MNPQEEGERPRSMHEARSDTRDSNRAFRWGIALVVVLVLLVLAYNFVTLPG